MLAWPGITSYQGEVKKNTGSLWAGDGDTITICRGPTSRRPQALHIIAGRSPQKRGIRAKQRARFWNGIHLHAGYRLRLGNDRGIRVRRELELREHRRRRRLRLEQRDGRCEHEHELEHEREHEHEHEHEREHEH
jgi:hypothetical protein